MAEIKSRIAVNEHIYHQNPGEEPTEIPSRYSRSLKTNEQPYERRETATEIWQPIECGWISECGLMVIKNLVGTIPLQKNPTPEEVEETAKQILLVRTNDQNEAGDWMIPPTETMKAVPVRLDTLQIKSLHGEIRFLFCLYPS